MSARVRPTLRKSLDRWYRIALPTYWIALFCLTHMPAPELPDLPQSDKIAHFAAYGLLAFLFWRFGEARKRPRTGAFLWYAALILCAYGALDEYLQSFVNRCADVVDWLCDVAGVALALGVLEWRRRKGMSLAPEKPGKSQGLDSAPPRI